VPAPIAYPIIWFFHSFSPPSFERERICRTARLLRSLAPYLACPLSQTLAPSALQLPCDGGDTVSIKKLSDFFTTEAVFFTAQCSSLPNCLYCRSNALYCLIFVYNLFSFVFFMPFFDLVSLVSFDLFVILSFVSIVSCVVQFFIWLAICRLLFLLFSIPFSLFSIALTRHSQLVDIFLKTLTLHVFTIIIFSTFAEKSL